MTKGAEQSTEIVGRDVELAALGALLEGAREGRGALALIVGEAGIGKTRLLDALCGKAREAGATITRARCWDTSSRAFWPWLQILRAVEDPPAPALDTHGGEADVSQRLALFDRVAAWLRSLARRAPLVVAIEDLHAADESSLLLLHYLAIELSGARVLFVGTMREEAKATTGVFAARHAELERVAHRVRLAGLDGATLGRLVGTDLPISTEALARATSGNPLFALELVDALRRAPTRAGEPLPLPETVRAALGARLATLRAETQRVLALAALLGPPIDPSLVAELGACSQASVLDALDEALGKDVLVAGVRGGEAHAFRHDLFRESALSALAGAERAALHLRAGLLLEAHAAPSRREASARHLLLALPLGSAEHAADRAAEIARAASDACAWESACDWYERALSALERASCPPARLLDAMIALAETQLAAGAVEAGRATAARAISLAESAELPRHFARAVLVLGTVQQMGQVDPRFMAQLEQALRTLPAARENDALRALLMARLATAQQPCAEYWRPQELAREAIALARRGADRRELATVIDYARGAFRVVDDLDERVALDEEQLALSIAAGASSTELGARRRLVVAALERGRVTEAFEQAQALGQLGARIGSPLSRWWALQLQCGIAIMQGRFDDARAFLDGAMAESEAGRALFGASFRASPVAMLPTALARAAGTRAPLERALLDESLPQPLRQVLRTVVHGQLGNEPQARTQLAHIASQGISSATLLWQRLALAEVSGRFAIAEHAAPILAMLEPQGGRAICWFPLGVCEGAYDRLRARLHHVLGDRARALALYESALALETQLGALPWLARTKLGFATLLAEPGLGHDLSRARSLHTEALATFDALGMELDLSAARAIAIAPPRTSGPPAARARPSFTQEGDVWSIAYGDERVQLPDLDGLRYLAWLVDHPETGATPTELLALSRRGPGTAPHASVETPMLDAKARAAYRERVADLRELLAEAEADHDLGRAERAQRELDQVTEELLRASGLGGRGRAMGGGSERARVNVTLRLRKAIEKIAARAPGLGAHLEQAVRTGSTCRYAP